MGTDHVFQETHSARGHFNETKQSGLLSSGGIGITLGSQRMSTGTQTTATGASASTVGSIQGNIDIQAGKNYTQTGSDILAPQGDINLAAQKIDITEARTPAAAAPKPDSSKAA